SLWLVRRCSGAIGRSRRWDRASGHIAGGASTKDTGAGVRNGSGGSACDTRGADLGRAGVSRILRGRILGRLTDFYFHLSRVSRERSTLMGSEIEGLIQPV